jgi:hypothetical protein
MALNPVQHTKSSGFFTNSSEVRDVHDPRPLGIFTQTTEAARTTEKPRRLSSNHSESSSSIGSCSEPESDEASHAAINEIAHEFTIRDQDALKTVNFNNPSTFKTQQDDIRRIEKAVSEYFKLVKEYFPKDGSIIVSHNQLAKLEAQRKELSFSTKQLHLDASAQRAERDNHVTNEGKDILFFVARQGGLPESAAEKLRKFLNQKIVLDPLKSSIDKKALSLLDSNLPKRFSKEYKEFKTLYLILAYKEALRLLCAKLNGYDKVLKSHKGLVNEAKIDRLIEAIKTPLKGYSDQVLYLSLIAKEITVRYVEGPYQHLIDKFASLFLGKLEDRDNKEREKEGKGKVKYSYGAIVESFRNQFDGGSTTDPAEEFGRAILGGFVTFSHKINKQETVLLAPFEAPEDPFQIERKVQEYVGLCQEKVGEKLFHDSTIVTNFTKYQMEFANKMKPGPKTETALEAQARVFNFLSGLKDNKPLFTEFCEFMNQNLVETNKKCMSRLREKGLDSAAIAEYLMNFYRVPFQTFIIEPTSILKYIYLAIFSKIDNDSAIISNLRTWKAAETKNIRILFDDYNVKFRFLRKGAIGKDIDNPIGVIVQDMVIKIPRPGRDKIADSVSLQFYYEPIEDRIVTAEEQVELDVNLERLSFVMKLLNLPPLQMPLQEAQLKLSRERSNS